MTYNITKINNINNTIMEKKTNNKIKTNQLICDIVPKERGVLIEASSKQTIVKKQPVRPGNAVTLTLSLQRPPRSPKKVQRSKGLGLGLELGLGGW